MLRAKALKTLFSPSDKDKEEVSECCTRRKFRMGSYGMTIFNVSAAALRGHSGKHTEEEVGKEKERI